MPILGIFASSLPVTNPSWMAYLGTTVNAVGVGAHTGSLYAVGADGTKKITAKYDKNGAIVWQRTLDNSAATTLDRAQGGTVDSSGNVYGGGYRCLWKYNSSGTIQWKKTLISTTSGNYFQSVIVDSSSNVYTMKQTGTGNTTTFTTLKLDSTPAITWQRLHTAATNYSWVVPYQGLAVDSSGNVYVTVTRFDDLAATNLNVYVIKYNSSGTIQWTTLIQSATTLGLTAGIALDSSGNPYVAWGVPNQTYLTKLNTSGIHQWTRNLTTSGLQGIAIDSSDNIYVGGTNTAKAFIAKYNSSGTIQWQRTITATLSGTGKNVSFNALSIDNTNSRIVAAGILDTEFFTLRIPTDGSKTGTYSLGGYSMVYAASSITDSANTPTTSQPSLTTTTPTDSLVDQTADTDAAGSYTSTSVIL